MKSRLLIIIGIIILMAITFVTLGTNPILHLMLSDEHIVEAANNSEMVQIFLDMYPESEYRLVRVLDQEPAIVYEMRQENKIAFLAVGNFQGDDLTYMYQCFANDYSQRTFELLYFSPTILKNNGCF
ncbi:MAG: hypothetical protein GKS07_09985 [Nitrosopumilus sp.]|nr:MAG: hypothetical protein GKS07_09985 [Nitrosopumilus sp.]